MLRLIGSMIVLAVFILGFAFAWLNTSTIEINYLAGRTEIQISFALFIALVVGWVLGIVSSAALLFRQRREISRLKREIKLAETEVNNLRTLPVKDAH